LNRWEEQLRSGQSLNHIGRKIKKRAIYNVLDQTERDVTIAFVFKEILEDEGVYHDFFTTMLEEV
jgi:hypothetical protein